VVGESEASRNGAKLFIGTKGELATALRSASGRTSRSLSELPAWEGEEGCGEGELEGNGIEKGAGGTGFS